MEIARDGALHTFYVDVNDRATVICPNCGTKKTVDASPFKDMKGALRVTCNCKEEFRCNFEFRKYYRKPVKLKGEYVNLKTGQRGDMLVQNLSIEGVGFETVQAEHNIEPGHVLTIRFTLDNPQETEVERAVKVTSVQQKSVGGMFSGQARNKTVGFYLMP